MATKLDCYAVREAWEDESPMKEAWCRWRFFAGAYLIASMGLWLTWMLPWNDLVDRSGTPLGGDFVMFYTAGDAVTRGHVETLYQDEINQAHIAAKFPSMNPHECWPYRYPPLVALVMSPLSRLPFPLAYGMFTTLSVGCLVLAVRLLWRLTTWSKHETLCGGEIETATILGSDRDLNGWRTLCLLVAGWPITIETLLGGQLSTVALLIVVASLTLLRKQRTILAGFVLGLACYKPNILMWFILGCVIRYPRLLIGLCLSTGLILAASVAGMGWQPWQEFAALGGRLATSSWSLETPFWKVHGLVPWLHGVIGEGARPCILVLGALSALAVGIRWRQDAGRQDGRKIACLLVVNALFNPYLPIYDLLLLLPAAVLLEGLWTLTPDKAKLMAQSSSELPLDRRLTGWQLGLFVIYFGPHLSQGLARTLGVQLFPIVLTAVGIWFGSSYFRGRRTVRPPASAALVHALLGQRQPSEQRKLSS